ncbi:GTPase Era OS=Streptomyces albaduncus OX=68172 GN=era PE=3 SV=1 [Streptomyces griseoloalbus]
MSATAGRQVDLLADLLIPLMPEGPALYPRATSPTSPSRSWSPS